MFTHITNLESILHMPTSCECKQEKPYCRFVARVAYSNTENKDLHRWSNTHDRFAVHTSIAEINQ
jgi:hypothetical protein